MFNPTPPGFPAPVTTGAGCSWTSPHPCGGALLHAGPNGLGFQRAPCGPPQSAGSAPSAGPESSPFPWPPGGREESGRQAEDEKGNEEWQMKEAEDGVQKWAIMMRVRERMTERQRERNICSTSSCTDRKMLALSSLIRDNGQVCSRQIASNTLALTGICKDFAAAQNLII